jgi:hypothetical protein
VRGTHGRPAGKPMDLRSRLRVAASSLLCSTSVRSAMVMAKGLDCPPVPPVLTTGSRCAQQNAISSALWSAKSMASRTKSYLEGGSSSLA